MRVLEPGPRGLRPNRGLHSPPHPPWGLVPTRNNGTGLRPGSTWQGPVRRPEGQVLREQGQGTGTPAAGPREENRDKVPRQPGPYGRWVRMPEPPEKGRPGPPPERGQAHTPQSLAGGREARTPASLQAGAQTPGPGRGEESRTARSHRPLSRETTRNARAPSWEDTHVAPR